LIIANPPWI